MVRGKPRGRPPKTPQKVLSNPPANPAVNTKKNEKKPIFMEASTNEDASDLPALEMRIYHQGSTHEPQSLNDKVIYKYKEPKGDLHVLDMDKIEELSCSDDANEDFCYEDKDKTVSVKKSLIDDYRQKSNYWGPLRIIAENVKVKENGVLKDAIQAKLQHVEIQATDNEGKNVNDHELKILMSQTPGIIPACDPPSKTDVTDEGYITLNLGQGEKYKVLKKAMNAFKKLSGVEPPFNTKIQKVFTTTDGKVSPVTLVTLYPRINKVVYQSTLVNDKNQPLKKLVTKKDKGTPKLVNYYRQSYINWSHRGNICFSEIKKAGVDFFEEILIENPLVDDSLQDLGNSSSSSASAVEDSENIKTPNEDESSHSVGSKDFVDELWQYLGNLVRSDSFLIEFEFEMDEEKWLEVKRAFNMFQLDGEVLPDIVLKFVSKKKDNEYSLSFYLRCIGRLIKWGPLMSKTDINSLFKCLAKDRYICVGLNKDNFLYQADQNEMLRQHVKETAMVSMLPFESLHDKKCKAIVRDTDNIENSKFQRGKVSVYGPSITCKSCDALLNRLKELQDPTLNPRVPQEISQRFVKQRYGPIQSINTSQNIKNLFTQTPYEFISNSKRKLAYGGEREEGENLPKLLKSMDSNLDIPEDNRPSVKVTEADFEKMITVKKYSSSSNLRKVCEECGFQAKTMLSLFTHMTDHLGPLTEDCSSCTMKVSSKEALISHMNLCHSKKSCKCSICLRIYPSSEKLFEHMSIHRACKPYQCSQCDERLQNLNAYKKHLKVNHRLESIKDMNYYCKVCNAFFYTADHLLIHKLNQNHCDKEHIKCKICNFSCSLVSAFVNHILHHSHEERENNNLATCSECKKVFFSTYKLDDHMKKKHEGIVKQKIDSVSTTEVENNSGQTQTYEGFTCGKCYKVYGTVNALQKHIEVSHPEKVVNEQHEQPSPITNVPTSLSCNMCGRKFNSEHFLNSHMKLHTANRPVFQCEECGYVYGKRTQVLEHIRNDHAEQVEKHQQMQQQHHHQQQQHDIIQETPNPNPTPAPIYGAQQPAAYPGGQVIGIHNHAHMLQPPQAGWNQLKIPTVEQPPEVPYNFPNFNSQFF